MFPLWDENKHFKNILFDFLGDFTPICITRLQMEFFWGSKHGIKLIPWYCCMYFDFGDGGAGGGGFGVNINV
jgi:hypothetical protein